MKHTGLHMPAHYASIEEESLSTINGGGSILSFISYILSGFRINFGSGSNHTNTDATVSTSGSGSVQHINVDTTQSTDYGNWSASFNLGSLFNALVRLFS